MGEPVFAVLSGITRITENLAVASYTTWNVILISISSLSCWSSHNHFLAGRFPHWNAIIWITCMSFIGWYINFWDLIEKNRLTWQVHTRLSPFWRQHDTPPPALHAVTYVPDSEITRHSSQHLFVHSHPRSSQHRRLLATSLVFYHLKEVPHCRLVTGGRVQ